MDKVLIGFSFLFKILLRLTNKPVVLCYHRITKQKFQSQVSFFERLGGVKPLRTLADDAFNKKPKFAIALTMDDCYYEDFISATQILEKHNLPCTFFVPTKYSIEKQALWPVKIVRMMESPNLQHIDEEAKENTFDTIAQKTAYKSSLINQFVWDENQTTTLEEKVEKISTLNNYTPADADKVIDEQVIKLYAANPLFSFQSHTVTHPKLYLQNPDELYFEFHESKNYLQQATQQQQYVICYPYGSAKHIGNSYQQAAKHYKYGVTLQTGSIKKTTNPMLIPRIGIYEHDTAFRILLKILNSQFK